MRANYQAVLSGKREISINEARWSAATASYMHFVKQAAQAAKEAQEAQKGRIREALEQDDE